MASSSTDTRAARKDDYEALRELKKRASELNFYSREEEIAATLKELSSARENGQWHLTNDEAYPNYVLQLLSLKQQEKLIEEQKQSSEELVTSTKYLAYATIALAIFTAILSLEPWLSGK